jgi:MoaA/NifB/PqqE/SkfB family radical SAM enzyme
VRVQRVVTNETCNQNCWFCNARRPSERPEYVARPAVRQRIAAAQTAGAREIVLTGGEPTLRSDIADLVQRATAGDTRVVLETNGALIDPVRAAALAAAGLHTARVQLTAWGVAADAISRDPGGFERTVAAIRALAAAGVQVEVTVPLVRRNLDLVAQLPREIAAAGLPVAALVLVIPVTAPDEHECAPLADLAPAVVAVADAARRTGLPVRLDAAGFIPPCVFDKPERVTHLYALNRGNASRPGYQPVPACAACVVNDRCPGFPAAMLARGDQPPVQPIREHRVRRRLTVHSTVEEQVAREYLGRDELRSTVGGDTGTEYTLRVNFHCNQACEFCFVSTHLPPAGDAAVRAAIAQAGREAAVLVLSGGEPTLNPRLVEYVALAKRSGVRAIELQSNAVRLADASLAKALAAAGVDRAMISLHGTSAEVSDAITGAPGTYDQTVRGIDHLIQAGVPVRLNFVFCQLNRHQFPSYVDMVAARWPQASIVFSFVGSHTDVVPRTTALIPRFADVLPALVAGLARAAAAGVRVVGFDSMCGLPLCLVPEAERYQFSSLAVAADGGGGEFVKGEACTRCSEGHRCYGVRRGYAELYGTDELVPFVAPAAAAPPA